MCNWSTRPRQSEGGLDRGATLVELETLAAIRSTSLIAAIAFPFNLVLGIAAAWRHRQV
jgi:ABC-type sulfate transport system permease subunit